MLDSGVISAKSNAIFMCIIQMKNEEEVKKIMNTLPKDPVMLLSVVNTKLRDQYPSLSLLCEDMEISEAEITKKLETIDYLYDINQNQFI